jgi:N-acetylmuramoyl-L-alanine amidase
MLKINKSIRSNNYNDRPENTAIRHVIIHYAEVPFDEAVSRLCDQEIGVSSHYIIQQGGEIFSLVDNEKRAWHAGKSFWQGTYSLNDCSIGIELDNNGCEPFEESLILSLIELCEFLKSEYSIPQENFIGHSDIAPNRKIDPGLLFPWKILADHGFGAWPRNIKYNNPDEIIFKYGDSGEQISELQQRLLKFGYGIEDSGVFDIQTSAAIRAFQEHYAPNLIIEKIGLMEYSNHKNIEDYSILSGIFSWTQNCDAILNRLLEDLE